MDFTFLMLIILADRIESQNRMMFIKGKTNKGLKCFTVHVIKGVEY